MRESASTDLREPQGSNPLGPPGPELRAPMMPLSSDAAVEARDAKGLAHDASIPSGCSFSNASAWIRSASGRSCGQGRDRIVRR